MQGRVNYDPDSPSKVKFCIFQGFWLLYTGENDGSHVTSLLHMLLMLGSDELGAIKIMSCSDTHKFLHNFTMPKPLCPSQNATQIVLFLLPLRSLPQW